MALDGRNPRLLAGRCGEWKASVRVCGFVGSAACGGAEDGANTMNGEFKDAPDERG